MAGPSNPFRWSWRSAKFRALVYQIIAVLLVAAAGWYLVHNTLANMRVRGIQSGFDFLRQPAGFSISESLFEFDSSERVISRRFSSDSRIRCAWRSSASCWRRFSER